jgi:hypothetical protein
MVSFASQKLAIVAFGLQVGSEKIRQARYSGNEGVDFGAAIGLESLRRAQETIQKLGAVVGACLRGSARR